MAFVSVLRQCGLMAIAAGMLASAVGASVVAVQAQSTGNPQPSGQTVQAPGVGPTPKRLHSGKKRSSKVAKVAPEPVPVEVPQPVEPVLPNWPVNAQAEKASVGWDGRQLSVAASNSSLHQILNDISTATGVKVDGLGGDQRVFGRYGPAPAREVIGQLLDGSGYNVLMIGDQGQGTPRELLLTAKGTAPVQPVNPQANAPQNANPDDEPQEEPEPPEQQNPIMNRPMAVQPQQQPPGGRTPQQMMQEMQQRQQQLQNQQQQQAQPQTPPN
jgi:hypothetical protein